MAIANPFSTTDTNPYKNNSINSNSADEVARSVALGIAQTAGVLNSGRKELMMLLDPQSKCNFEMIVYPTAWSFKSFALSFLGNTVYQLLIQTLEVPFPQVDYEYDGTYFFPKEYMAAGDITLTLIENELSTARIYVDAWTRMSYSLKTDFYTMREEVVFKDNQEAAKVNAVINLQSGLGLPTLAVVKLTGLKLKGIDNLSLSQADGDPMIISITCAVDKVEYKSLVSSAF